MTPLHPRSRGPEPARGLRRTLALGWGLALMLGLGLWGPVFAQSPGWPARPIKLIVPYPAGGNADQIGRLIAERLSGSLGQQVVVENRAGAGATIGAQAVARAPADGYTLLLAPSAVMVITHHLRKVPYDPEADFAPIASLSSSYGLVAARPDFPASTMAELVTLARQQPGRLSFGSAGTATATHLSGEIVHHRAGIKVLHVPYKGSAESLTDLLGGRIDLIYDPVAFAQVKAGKLKVLATTAASRHPDLPDVPTLKEQGIDADVGSWFGLFAPRGTPAEVLERVATEAGKAMNSPGMRETLLKFSQYPDYRNPAQFSAQIQADNARYKALIQTLGIKVE